MDEQFFLKLLLLNDSFDDLEVFNIIKKNLVKETQSNVPNFNISDYNNPYSTGVGWLDNSINAVSSMSPALGNVGNQIGGSLKGAQSIYGGINNLIGLNKANKALTTAGQNKLEGSKNAIANNAAGIVSGVASTINPFINGKTDEEMYGVNAGKVQAAQGFVDMVSNAHPIAKAINEVGKLGVNAYTSLGGEMATGRYDADLAVSPLAGINILNSAFGGNLHNYTRDETLFDNIGESYTGSNSLSKYASSIAGQRYGYMASKLNKGKIKKDNKSIDQAIREVPLLTQVKDQAEIDQALYDSASMISQYKKQYDHTSGLNSLHQVSVGKQGTKLPTNINEVSYILEINDEVDPKLPTFQKGGSVNVIPEGSLHARLHHMEDDENITKKGIPVISENDNGDIKQQAEIERGEIIYRISVTEKLEELAKKFEETKDDKYAIEAGQLLINETLYNTIDNTNELL